MDRRSTGWNAARRLRRTLLAALLTMGFSEDGSAADVFNTRAAVPAGPAAPVFGSGADVCRQRPLPVPLPLLDAIERTLCESPKTRSAWAAVKAAAAGVGADKAAYLPSLEANADYELLHNSTAATVAPVLRSNFTQGVSTESLSLVWVLYDFGGRAAALHGDQEYLAAAQATQNATLQAALANAARDYYAAQAAVARAATARRIEASTHEILNAATARFGTGVAPVTDRLQANTAYVQAIYDRAAAEGALRTAIGALAVDMNLAPDEPLTLPDMDQGALPDVGFVSAVHELMAEATRTHPTIVAARAQWQAALDNVGVVRAQGMPKLQLTGDVSRTDQPQNSLIGEPATPALSHQGSIGLSVSVPLFEGFGRQYRVRQAEAVAEQQAQALRDAEQQVALGVWSSFQSLETDTENLRNTATILDSARQAFEAAQQRYTHGVGGILELLNVQNALANAEQQRVQAQSDWRIARLQLAASLGQLGLWAIQ